MRTGLDFTASAPRFCCNCQCQCFIVWRAHSEVFILLPRNKTKHQ